MFLLRFAGRLTGALILDDTPGVTHRQLEVEGRARPLSTATIARESVTGNHGCNRTRA